MECAGRLASVYSYPSAVSLPGCSSLVESLSVEFDKNKLFQLELVTILYLQTYQRVSLTRATKVHANVVGGWLQPECHIVEVVVQVHKELATK